MTGWHSFEGAVQPTTWGRATHTFLRVPPGVANALSATGAKRVEGEINENPVNLALSRASATEGAFLWSGRSLLNRIGVEPEEPPEVRLRPESDDLVDIPDDVQIALRAARLTDRWNALSAGKRRGLLYKVATAKTHATRAKRIAMLVGDLS